VDHSLPYFRHLSPAVSQLLFQALFREQFSSLPLSPSPVHSEHPALSAVCLFQLLVYYSVFLGGAGVSLSRGLSWIIPGVAVGIQHVTDLLTCWSAFPKQV
jgi:hypothetical protein